MPLTRRHVLVAASASVALLATGCATSSRAAGAKARIARPYVLVSGRDDHGLVELASVPLVAAPGSHQQVGSVPDGTLARLLDVRGTWLDVAPVRGVSAPGWVDDYRLRGVVHLVGAAPSCRVTVRGHRLPVAEQAEVLDVSGDRAWVRLVRHPDVSGPVPLRFVRELPPTPDDPCPAR
jgi:hypothetical protein